MKRKSTTTTKRKKPKTATTRRTGLRSATVFSLLAACLLLILTTRAPLYGADRPKPKDYALIIGSVWWPDDAPVYGMAVNIRRTNQKKPKWHVYSDHHWTFAQRYNVGKADYEIWADTKVFIL